MTRFKHYLRLILNILLPVAVLLAAFLLIPRIFRFFAPFLLALIVAFVANPLVSWLDDRTFIKRGVFSVIFTVLIVVLTILTGYLLVNAAVDLFSFFSRSIPSALREFELSFNNLFDDYEHVWALLPENVILAVRNMRTDILYSIRMVLTKIARPTLNLSLSAVRFAPILLVYIIIFFSSSIYFLNHWDLVTRFLCEHMPEAVKNGCDFLRKDMVKVMASWLSAQFKIMAVIFIFLAVSFSILGVAYAFQIALITSFLDFLPALGTGFVIWPWIAYDLITGRYLMGFWLAVVYLATQIIRRSLEPRIMSSTMGLNPLLTLFFMYLGLKLSGIAGMIFAVPVGMLLMSVYRFGAFDPAIASAKQLMADLKALLAGGKS